MTGEHIANVATTYANALRTSGGVAEKENGTSLQHALWMCCRIPEFVQDHQYDKANRWLGFVQGVLFNYGVYSIDEMRAHNRTPDDEKSVQDKIVDELVHALDIAAWPTSAMRVQKQGTTSVMIEVLQPGNTWRTHHLTVNDVKEEAKPEQA